MTDQSIPTPSFEEMRRAMVASQLRTTAVNDPRVVEVMGEVPRERFVPEEWRRFAYADRAIPLAPGRMLMTAMATGRLLTELRTKPGERALVVAAGTGYAAALLARLVGPVTALEDMDALPFAAEGVERVTGPLAGGWAQGAPYDIIYIDGAVDEVPAALIGQLAEGGRLAAAIVSNGVARLSIGTRAGHGFGTVSFAEADVPLLRGFAKPRAFTF